MICLKKIIKVSIGNYIINNGDLAAIILINSISRYNTNLIKPENIKTETFNKKMFEYKKYISNNKTQSKNITFLKEKNVIRQNENKLITSFYRPDIINRFKHE